MTDDEALSLHLKLVEYHLDKAKIAVIESARGYHLTLARKFCDEASRTNQRVKESRGLVDEIAPMFGGRLPEVVSPTIAEF